MLSSSSSSSFYMRRNDNHSSSNNKKTVNELVKKASKQALTIAHNRHLDKQHVKINLYISRMRRIPFVFKRSLINISRSSVMLPIVQLPMQSCYNHDADLIVSLTRSLSLSLSLSVTHTHTHTHTHTQRFEGARLRTNVLLDTDPRSWICRECHTIQA